MIRMTLAAAAAVIFLAAPALAQNTGGSMSGPSATTPAKPACAGTAMKGSNSMSGANSMAGSNSMSGGNSMSGANSMSGGTKPATGCKPKTSNSMSGGTMGH